MTIWLEAIFATGVLAVLVVQSARISMLNNRIENLEACHRTLIAQCDNESKMLWNKMRVVDDRSRGKAGV